MGWNRRWLGVGLVGMSGWLLTGCVNEPDWALPTRSYSADISQPASPVVRSQIGDVPSVTLKKPETPSAGPIMPLIAPPPGFGITPERPSIQPVSRPIDTGTQQASFVNRGKVRVRVRAWVNGRPIFEDEVMQAAGPELRRVYSLPENQRAEKVTELMNLIIDHIVDQEVMYQDAIKKIEKASPKSLEKMRDYVDHEFGKTVQKMRDQKVPDEQIREIEPTARRMMERNLISTEYARSRIKPSLESIGMREIRDYYETHLNEFMSVDTVVWQDIFIPTKATLPTVEDVKRFAEQMINKCRTPEDFNQLMVYNDGDSKLRGGEGLGRVLGKKAPNGEWLAGEIRPAELEPYLVKLREGEIGPVIPFSSGVHLIRVTKREYAGQMPLDDQVQKSIRKKLESQLADREYRRIIRELRTRAVVRIERDSQ